MVAESGGMEFLRQSISGTEDNQSPQSRHVRATERYAHFTCINLC